MEPESIYDNQAANLFAGANGSAIGFGSGVTIEEIETDGNLSLVAIDFF
ncbi:hypothetical protein SynWH8101_1210 [Synechococcus sp. WH 8101]|nr:hypothetical protein SynWH8101_1210 [Synechococcus sp. WH 8101]QNI45019.1 hypothetical protein SynRCC2555_01236 [Synechococcus sp. WH 8101]